MIIEYMFSIDMGELLSKDVPCDGEVVLANDNPKGMVEAILIIT